MASRTQFLAQKCGCFVNTELSCVCVRRMACLQIRRNEELAGECQKLSHCFTVFEARCFELSIKLKPILRIWNLTKYSGCSTF